MILDCISNTTKEGMPNSCQIEYPFSPVSQEANKEITVPCATIRKVFASEDAIIESTDVRNRASA
jgi:hypothetical protein